MILLMGQISGMVFVFLFGGVDGGLGWAGDSHVGSGCFESAGNPVAFKMKESKMVK